MVAYRLVLAGFVAAASASAFPAEEELFKSLLKRQEPGTPAYDCHDNCGTAITQSRGSDPCSDEAFLYNYKNCLQCSGPDNYNIWRYYGGTLTAAGGKCGLDTTPLSGKQEDVPPANHGSGSGGASSAPPASSPAPTTNPDPTSGPSEEPTSGPGEAPTSSPAPTSGPAPSTGGEPEPTQGTTAGESSGPVPSGTASGYPEEEPSVSSSASSHPTTASGGVVPSGAPTSSGNGTATFTTGTPPAEATTNAAVPLDMSKAAGVLGAMVFGVVYGF